MLARKAGGYGKIHLSVIKRALSCAPMAVLSHWMFQSLLYMDRTERWFKLSLDFSLMVFLGILLQHWLAAFLIAHTMNFLFNGQLWGALKHYGFTHWQPADFSAYTKGLIERAQRQSSLQSMHVYGSLSRNEWTDQSDLDARLLRKPGVVNGLRACTFLLTERTRALLKRFPLDLYVLDSVDSAARLCPAERSNDLLTRSQPFEKIQMSPVPTTVAFLRGVNFAQEIGASDWRIALSFPEFGFRPTIFGKGPCSSTLPCGVKVFAPQVSTWFIIGTLQLTFAYLLKLLRLSPKVVICNPGLFLAGNLYRLLRPRTKLILDIRSTPVEGRGLIRRLQQQMFQLGMRSPLYDGVSVITSGMLAEVRHDYGVNAHLPTVVWESAYDEQVFHLPAEPRIPTLLPELCGKFVLMFHGSLSPQRGLDQVIRSLRLLRRCGLDDVVLVLIGKGAAQASLQALAKEQQVGEQVIFLPPMAYHALPAYVARADLGLDPLPDHPWWRNQSALKVYEYLALGKPVLATDLPCHRDISEAVILLPDNRPEIIAQGVISFRNLTAATRTALQQAALTDAARHTWRARAHTLAHFIFSDVLHNNAAADCRR